MDINDLINDLDVKLHNLVGPGNLLNTFKPLIYKESSIKSLSDGGTDGSAFVLSPPQSEEYWEVSNSLNTLPENEIIVRYAFSKSDLEEYLKNDLAFNYNMIMVIQGMVTTLGKYTSLSGEVATLRRSGNAQEYFMSLDNNRGLELRLYKMPLSYAKRHGWM